MSFDWYGWIVEFVGQDQRKNIFGNWFRCILYSPNGTMCIFIYFKQQRTADSLEVHDNDKENVQMYFKHEQLYQSCQMDFAKIHISLLKVPTSVFTKKNLLRLYARQEFKPSFYILQGEGSSRGLLRAP